MDYKEKATILRVCSSRKGERCSRCLAFGQGDRHCARNAMKDGATAITELLAENAALRKMQPVQLDDTGAKAAALDAEVSELRQKLAEADARAEKEACISPGTDLDDCMAIYNFLPIGEFRQKCTPYFAFVVKNNEELIESLQKVGAQVLGETDVKAIVYSPEIYRLRQEVEEEKARAEKAERERDAAVKWIKAFTESIGQPCVACKHDTGDFVSLGVCGGCSKENDKWEWCGQKEE